MTIAHLRRRERGPGETRVECEISDCGSRQQFSSYQVFRGTSGGTRSNERTPVPATERRMVYQTLEHIESR